MQMTIPMLMMACLCSQVPKPSGQTGDRTSQTELATLAWEYFRGNGFTWETLDVRSGGRFSYAWGADDGGYHRQEGTAEVVDDYLVLHPVKSESNRGIGHIAHPNYHPIRWGQRLYLLADGDMLPFCNAINLGLEPRREIFGMCYVKMKISEEAKRGEELPVLQNKVEGLPGLPKRWGTFLLRGPLTGSVIEVLKDKRARIDLGSHDGLKVGMELFVLGEEKSSARRPYGIAKWLPLRRTDAPPRSNVLSTLMDSK